jgi:hypothetical protein
VDARGQSHWFAPYRWVQSNGVRLGRTGGRVS